MCCVFWNRTTCMIKTNRIATNIKGLVESDTICTDDGLANIEGQNT